MKKSGMRNGFKDIPAIKRAAHADGFRRADSTYWECHLFSYTNDTLKRLSEKTGVYGIKHIKQIKRYNLSNILYWLSKGMPDSHSIWNIMNDPFFDKTYGGMLAKNGIADTIIAGIEK